MDLCDNESIDENNSLLFLFECEVRESEKERVFVPFRYLRRCQCQHEKEADGGRPTHKESRGSEADSEKQFLIFCKQLWKVVHFQAYDRRRMVAPGHLVVETNGKQCDVRQDEEHDDESMKVGLSFTDHKGARRCAISGMLVGNACSLYRGCSNALLRKGGS